MNKRTSLAAAMSALALLATTACGGGGGGTSSSGDKINFVFNFAASGFHSGFAVAKQRGMYADEGLDVTLTEGQGSTTTAQLVASGKVDLAYADAAAVMPLIAKGAPIKIVATLTQVSPNQVTALADTDLTGVGDLKGKSLGVPAGSSQIPMVPILLKDAGLTEQDIKQVSLPGTSLVPSLIQGKVDAILGSVDAYGIQLTQQGAKTDNYLMADNGVKTVSVSIIARDDYLKDNSDSVRKFVAASLKGWDATLDDQASAVDDLIDVFPGVKREQATRELAVTPPLFCRDNTSVGKADPAQWETATTLLKSVDLLPASANATDFYTYNYLPKTLRAC